MKLVFDDTTTVEVSSSGLVSIKGTMHSSMGGSKDFIQSVKHLAIIYGCLKVVEDFNQYMGKIK